MLTCDKMTDVVMPQPKSSVPAMPSTPGIVARPADWYAYWRQSHRQGKEGRQLPQRTIHQDNLGHVGGKGRRPAQGDRHIGRFERNGVVDAVADKADLVAFFL